MRVRRLLQMSAALLAAALPTASTEYVVRDGKFSVVNSAGSTSGSRDISAASSGEGRSPISVEGLDTLKLTFTLATGNAGTTDEETLSQPTQLSVLAKGIDSDRSWTAPVKLRLGGKARWELDMTRAPPAFLNLSPKGRISLELLIAGLKGDHTPVRLPLAILELDTAVVQPYPFWGTPGNKPPPELEWERYAPQPEQSWTFRPAEKPVNPVISLIFTAIALSPWVFLTGAWSYLSRTGEQSGFSLSSSPSTSTVLFLLLLFAEELLIVTYWTSLRLYQFLPLALALSVPLVLTGRSALGQLRDKRLERPIGRSAAAAKGKGKGKTD